MSVKQHCLLCMVENKCDIEGCDMAFLADGREPTTTDEFHLANQLTLTLGDDDGYLYCICASNGTTAPCSCYPDVLG